MPSLQIDLPASLAPHAKRDLAGDLGAIYAEVMDVKPDIVTVVVRDLGEGGVWRCGPDDPSPAGLLMADVRAGRPAEARAALARRLIEACAAASGLHPNDLKVEFTQHSGDEMFHPQLGGFNDDWSPGEGKS